ncbi:DNA-(apurinic or apyrimidinic site) endonuclease-like [Microplitis mediator]|uniref:DNA-(apurinic or apyrimidinic site) endonuclease-like n=1 Tax=Microplitis mediator TaxID=375433 RepID=UPI002553A84D|nr:DNA-(apurinic or apyrimidinic site) endonuclease-like [Microplitis mediator]
MGNTLVLVRNRSVVSRLKELRFSLLNKLNDRFILTKPKLLTSKDYLIKKPYFELFTMPPKRGRAAKDKEVVEETNGHPVVESEPVRKGRTRQVADKKSKEEDIEENVEEVAAKKSKTLKADKQKKDENDVDDKEVVEAGKKTKATRAGKKDKKNEEDAMSGEEVEEKKVRAVRGKKKENDGNEDATSEESVEVEKKGRARGKKEKKVDEEDAGSEGSAEVDKKSKPARGRKKKEEDATEEETKKAKASSKVSKKKDEEEEKKPVRGRKKKTEDSDEDVEAKVDKKVKASSKAAAKKKKDEVAEDGDEKMEEGQADQKQDDEENGDEQDKKSKPKAGRKKKADQDVDEEVEEAPKKTRGTRAAKKKSDDDNAEDDEPVAKKPKTPANRTDTDLDSLNFDCDKVNANGQKANIKICSWNVSGVRALMKKNGFEYILKENADVIALQETKCDLDKLPEDIELPGYKHKFIQSNQSGYCGIAIYSKKEFISVTEGINDPELDTEGRMLTVEYPEFYVINVYVPNAGDKLKTMDKRLKWNKIFLERVKELDAKKPVVICGDLNVAHKEIDLKNPKTNTKHAGFTPEEREAMTELLNAGFVDTFRHFYPDKTDAYTFWSNIGKAREKNVGWRLDYFVVSEKIKDNICDTVIRDQVFGSDHCPIILYANL